MLHYNCLIHFDDNLEICQEISEYGILPFHLTTSDSSTLVVKSLQDADIVHNSFPSFVDAAKTFILEYRSGVLLQKLRIVQASAKSYSVPSFERDEALDAASVKRAREKYGRK